jgi:DNA-binding transcriptional regulator GbsR (MarR family)
MPQYKSQEPKPDWGFYAMTPRIVRTRYKDLSHAEKWLYTCLKDLCGDKGSCFRSLRSLSEETDISTGSLSKMIPHLDEVGLIHAEKKKRTASGKEIWHITIIDIWQENANACSKNEQASDEVVQKMNDVVQKMNELPRDCSKNERDCSNFVDRRITMKNKESEEYKREEESIAGETKTQTIAPIVAPSPSSLSSSLFSEEETKPKEKPPSKKKEKTEPVEPKGPPVMPPQDAPWPSRETAVQIVEAKKGRIYSNTTRKQELEEVGKILEMSIGGMRISREQFEYAWDDIASSGWWEEHGKPCMIKYLRRDDSIITILNKRSKKPASTTQKSATHGTASHDGYTKEERISLFSMSQEERKNYNQKRREERERNANGLAAASQYV